MLHPYEKFIKAKPSHPCPICGKTDWCGFNGYLASCMRIKEGSFKTVVQGNGSEAHLHRLKPDKVVVPKRCHHTPPVPVAQIAPVRVRDKVYRDFIKLLSLLPRHMNDLIRRGLSEEDIEQNGYKSIPESQPWNICRKLLESGHDLSGIPGFYKARGPHGGRYWTFDQQPGYFIPVQDAKGRIKALQRRMDDPTRGGKYKLFSGYISRGGCSSGTPAHVARSNEVADSRIWITEGPLKADIAAKYLGATVIGALSAAAWQPALDAVLQLKAKEVVVAYDMDSFENPLVNQSEKLLKNELLKNEIKVFRATWDINSGKGIDDVLAAVAGK